MASADTQERDILPIVLIAYPLLLLVVLTYKLNLTIQELKHLLERCLIS